MSLILLTGQDHRNVAAFTKLDDDLIVAAFRLVIAFELRTQPPRFNPNDGVNPGIKCLKFVKDFNPDQIFLQRALTAFKTLFDSEA